MSERDWLSRFFHEEVEPRLRAEAVYGELAYKRGPCPLHRGDNASAFSVHGLSWSCWTHCGHGDAAAFLERRDGLTFLEAVRILADLVGATFPAREVSPEERARHEERSRRSRVFETFLAQARRALLADTDEAKRARAYLIEKRGFPEAALEGLDLGLYTMRADVKRRLLEAELPEADVDASGLLRDGRWEGRLVGAWRDVRGDVGTFWARDMTGKAEAGAKYLRLAVEHGWGRKEEDLVAAGLDVALGRDANGKADLVLVEGFLDVPSLRAHGFANVAALGGTGKKLSTKRWEDLHALGVREVTLALDADKNASPGELPAGLAGTLAALDAHQKADKVRNAPVCYVVPPEALDGAKDPDELVREKGLEAFRAALEKRVSGTVFRGLSFLEGVTPSSGEAEKRRAVEAVARFIGGGLPGTWGKREETLILEGVASRTGWDPAELAPVLEEASRKAQAEAEKALLETAIREAQDGVRAGTDLGEVRRKLEAGLVAARGLTLNTPPPFSVARLIEETRQIPDGLPSGWDALDSCGVRFNPGELALVAARTSHAKTTTLVGLLRNWLEADEDGLLVFYSHEEPEVRIFHRLLALFAVTNDPEKWTANEVRDYLRSPDTRGPHYKWPSQSALEDAQDRLRELEDRLLVVYRPAWRADEIGTHARGLADRGKVGAVLVDYLQRVRPPEGDYGRRDMEVSEVSRCFKALSVELEAPVVVGAQVNREAIPDRYAKNLSGKTYKEATSTIREARPELNNLREGGSEQEADLVLGLLNYQADYKTEAKATGDYEAPPVTLLEVGILKSRYGDVGRWAGLAFERRFGLIRDPSAAEENELAVDTKSAGQWVKEHYDVQRLKETERTKRAELETEQAKAKAEAARHKAASKSAKKPPTSNEADS